MFKNVSLVAVLILSLLVGGCAPGANGYGGGYGNSGGGILGTGVGIKQGIGVLGGAAAGGLAGAQVGKGNGQLAATAAGVLLGAVFGNEVGKSLDRADEMYASQAFQRAASIPLNQQVRWDNPESGNSGQIVMTREGRNQATNAYCREYQQTIVVGGRTQPAQGTACQQPDGSWKLQN